MIKTIETSVLENCTIQLPESLVKRLLLRKGDTVRLSIDLSLKNKCFRISSENDEELFDEEFYCVPKRIFDNCGISYDDIQIIMNKGSVTLTSSDAVISSLGKEMIACLVEQDVDFQLLADDLVECMNDEMYEEDNESKEDI